jgi:hypothetical protein
MPDKKPQPIPAVLPSMLETPWEPSNHSACDLVFNDREDTGRRTNPSHYIHRADEGKEHNNGMTYAEAKGLVKSGALGRLIKDHGTHISINEHAQHAICDFC